MTFILTYPFVMTGFTLRKNKLSSTSIDHYGYGITGDTRFMSELRPENFSDLFSGKTLLYELIPSLIKSLFSKN